MPEYIKCPNCGSIHITRDPYANYPLYYCESCWYKWRE